MKQAYFVATCASAGAFSGVLSERFLVGWFSGFALYWLLLSADAIVNGAPREPRRGGVIPADCETEL